VRAMLVSYRLAPAANRLNDPDWLGSTRCDAVHIAAGSERQAREAAALAFSGAPATAWHDAQGGRNARQPGSRPMGSPWLQPRLVEATEAGAAPDDVAAGTVLTDRRLDTRTDTLGPLGNSPPARAPSPASRRRSRRSEPPPASAEASR